MSLEIIAIFVVLLQAVSANPVQTRSANKATADSAKCGAVEFWNLDTESCQQCPNDTYMTAERAETGVQYACVPCSRPDEATYEILKENCTLTKDAIILCDKYHYRKKGSSSKEDKCTTCGICGEGVNSGLPYIKAACINYTDTVCSLPPNTSPNTTTEQNNGVVLVSYSPFVVGNFILFILVSSLVSGCYLFS